MQAGSSSWMIFILFAHGSSRNAGHTKSAVAFRMPSNAILYIHTHMC